MSGTSFLSTKEKILQTALKLFAKDGFEAVSVSAIAFELGITKGALYRHYKNKQDIFDSIVERMFQMDSERSDTYGIPEHAYEVQPEDYMDTRMDPIYDFMLAQLHFWTEDDFAVNFRKMLSLEQYRNPEMMNLYHNCITRGPVAYLTDIFSVMKKEGRLKEQNPELLALEFYSPLFLLIQTTDAAGDLQHAEQLLKEHITRLKTLFLPSFSSAGSCDI